MKRAISPLGSSFFDVGWEKALSLSRDESGGHDADRVAAKAGEGSETKTVTFQRTAFAGHAILHPAPRPSRHRLPLSTFGFPTPIDTLRSYPVPNPSTRFSDSTFAPTGLVVESFSPTSSIYPSSSYPAYPQPPTISLHRSRSPYSHERHPTDDSLSPLSSYAGFSPYQQYQPYTFTNNLSFQHPPRSSQPSSNVPLAPISPYGMTSCYPAPQLHHPVAERIPTHLVLPLSPEPAIHLALEPPLPLSPASTSSHLSSGRSGTKRRVPESLEEMLEDEEIMQLSNRVARGHSLRNHGSATWETGTGMDDGTGTRSSFGISNYPSYPDHLSQSTLAQTQSSVSLQPTSSSPLSLLPSGSSLLSFPSHVDQHRSSHEPSAPSATDQVLCRPPAKHALVFPPQQPCHLAALTFSSAQLPLSSHFPPPIPSAKPASLPSDLATCSDATLLYPIPVLVSVCSITASTAASDPPEPKRRTGKHSNWDLPPGAYATLSAPEKKRARNRFASKALRERKKEEQRVAKESKVSYAFYSFPFPNHELR
jgi:hypothetical protein